uniref:Uncharacterized protein n=1 Tax=Fagus sylvatica TaxID=28930 RepID=A0A2N9F877_FAGSY
MGLIPGILSSNIQCRGGEDTQTRGSRITSRGGGKDPQRGRGEATAESRRYETPNLSRENTTQLGSGQSGEAFQRLGSGSGSVEAWTRELDDEDELELKLIKLHQEPTELIGRIQAPGWHSLHGAGPAHANLVAQAGPSDLVAQDRSKSSSKEALRFDFEMIKLGF